MKVTLSDSIFEQWYAKIMSMPLEEMPYFRDLWAKSMGFIPIDFTWVQVSKEQFENYLKVFNWRRHGGSVWKEYKTITYCRESFDHKAIAKEESGKYFVLREYMNTDMQLDCIYDEIDDFLSKGQFALVNGILESIATDEYSTSVLIGFLTATLPAKSNLPFRPTFFCRVERCLKSRNQLTEDILRGLE